MYFGISVNSRPRSRQFTSVDAVFPSGSDDIAVERSHEGMEWTYRPENLPRPARDFGADAVVVSSSSSSSSSLSLLGQSRQRSGPVRRCREATATFSHTNAVCPISLVRSCRFCEIYRDRCLVSLRRASCPLAGTIKDRISALSLTTPLDYAPYLSTFPLHCASELL